MILLFLFLVIDGEKIKNLVHIKPYSPSSDVPEKNDQDDYVLRKLLKKSGKLVNQTLLMYFMFIYQSFEFLL